MGESLDIPTKRAFVTDPLTPTFKVIKSGQIVYSGIDGKFKDSLWDNPQIALPSNAILLFHNQCQIITLHYIVSNLLLPKIVHPALNPSLDLSLEQIR